MYYGVSYVWRRRRRRRKRRRRNPEGKDSSRGRERGKLAEGKKIK